jgi:hypothetical protein
MQSVADVAAAWNPSPSKLYVLQRTILVVRIKYNILLYCKMVACLNNDDDDDLCLKEVNTI